MIEEQEAVHARLFTIQDVLQSTVRAWLQDRSLTHNLGVFGGCGLILSIITGLFGINVDGIPGAEGSPYAFALFSCILFLLGAALIAIGLLYLGLKSPINDEHVEVRKLELQELVRIFQQEAGLMHRSEKQYLLPPFLQLPQQVYFQMVQVTFSSVESGMQRKNHVQNESNHQSIEVIAGRKCSGCSCSHYLDAGKNCGNSFKGCRLT